jgi:hypothetical protein
MAITIAGITSAQGLNDGGKEFSTFFISRHDSRQRKAEGNRNDSKS